MSKLTKRCLLLPLALTFLLPSYGQRMQSKPGVFDYYLLTLSWSPEFCYAHRNFPECSGAKRYGFIVHGLWPQFANGRYPEHCSTQPGPADRSVDSDIMPDPSLVQHEWTAHGTCSGLAANAYFALIQQEFQSIRIPNDFISPTRSFTVRPAELKRAFEKANPALSNRDLVVNCSRGYLTGIQICLTKDGKQMSCPASNRDCQAGTIRVPPVR